jgi:hypothetical protein
MENFNDFTSLYDYLEKNAIDCGYSQISDLFQKLRDLKRNENKLDEAEIAQWEIDFFSFRIKEGELHPMLTVPNDKGDIVECPTLDRFDDRTYDYLIKRLHSVSNPLLKARYSNILWCSPKKHSKHAKMSEDSYLELIKIYEVKDVKEPKEHYGLDVLRSFINAYSIAYQMKYNVDKVKLELKRLITKFNSESSSSLVLRANLIELMLNNKRKFLKKDFLGVEKTCWQLSKSLTKLGNLHGTITILELGEKVDQKLEQKTHDWRREIAETYTALMEQSEKENASVAIEFCLYALKNYKKLKDKNKINELEKKYSDLKKLIKFAEFKMKIDLSEHIKKCKEIAEKIVQNDSDKIIKLLILNKELLPKYKDLGKLVESDKKKFPLPYLFPIEIRDQNWNVSQYFSDEEEIKYYNILYQYDLECRYDKIYLINEIFYAAIHENKLSTNILLDFFTRNSWFGKNISKKLGNKEVKYNWLSLLAPPLHDYFLQIQYYFTNPNFRPNLVLSIDSLTLKIEGLIRDMCEHFDVPTFFMTTDNKGRTITREKDIHALLYEDSIKQLFDEDDLLFFKFLLVEKAGFNLRHKIAHALMFFPEYNISYMHLLILALLRIGKYDFVRQKGEKSI